MTADAIAATALLTEALRQAITDEGPRPEYHRAVMVKHRREWPVLWTAIDALLSNNHCSRHDSRYPCAPGDIYCQW